MNSWSNEKFLYLRPDALKALGEDKFLLPINKDIRFHDAISTKVALYFKDLHFVKEVYLDQEITKQFPLMEKTPDVLISGEKEKPFKLAIEIELSQKNKTRVQDILRRHGESKIVNNIVYITDKNNIFDSYQAHLDELGAAVDCSKFIFIFERNLNTKTFSLLDSKASYRRQETSLRKLLNL